MTIKSSCIIGAERGTDGIARVKIVKSEARPVPSWVVEERRQESARIAEAKAEQVEIKR